MQQLQIPAVAEGETYIGSIGDKNGDAYHLIMLSEENEGATWQDAMDWSKSVGGDLPNRIEQAMLFAYFKDQFKPDWYWSNQSFVDPDDEEDDRYAWCQGFSLGGQYDLPKNTKLRALAVRRLPI